MIFSLLLSFFSLLFLPTFLLVQGECRVGKRLIFAINHKRITIFTFRDVFLDKPTNMRKILVILALVSIFSSCKEQGTMSFKEVENSFADPGKEFRPAPLWTWNARVNHEDIDTGLRFFKDQGFGGAFIHPRPGLETDYLSDEWFELYRYSVEKAKELGLDIWIYDENSYPSGFAGGHVQREMPESWDHTVRIRPHKFEILPEDLSTYAYFFKQEGEDFADISSDLESYKGKPGVYCLYTLETAEVVEGRSAWHGGYPYVDLLYPGVTEKFLEITTSGYEKEFGKDLAPLLHGMFTDEPRCPFFTPAMFDEFKKDWGYDLLPNLPKLAMEVGDWKKVRRDYAQTRLRLFEEHWSKPYSEYCESHGLVWTGHYWEHEWPRTAMGPDNMAMYRFHQMPAIDMLFNGFDEYSTSAQFGNVRSVKEVRSVANQCGRQRVLCETYGGAGWDMTFEDMKRLADWEYALGINFMNQHYSNVTIEGARKMDYPDYFTRYSPWGEDYKLLNDHVGRLSLVLSQGEQLNDILVIEPTNTVWQYDSEWYGHPKVGQIGNGFQAFVTGLEKAQYEYDLGSEDIIKDLGDVKGNKFIVGQRAYSFVVVPEQVEVLYPETEELLASFESGGGKVIWMNRGDNMTDVPKGGVVFENLEETGLYHHRREYRDGELIFLANSSLTEVSSGTLTIKGAGLIEYDTMTGEKFSYPSAPAGKGEVRASFTLPPAGHLLLFASRKKVSLKGRPSLSATEPSVLQPNSDLTVKRLSDNYLTLDACDIYVDGKLYKKDDYVVKACRDLYARFGMSNPWESAIQYRQEAIDADTLTVGDVHVQYSFEIVAGTDRSSLKLVCEKPWLWEVTVNGGTPVPLEGVHPLDARTGCFDISALVKDGKNVVDLHIPHMSVFAEISDAFICGDFSVVPCSDGWGIAPSSALGKGWWCDQGMPFYSWTVSYSRTYNVDDPSRPYRLVLDDLHGTVAEVLVNGEKAGIIGWKPFEINLSGLLKEGQNVVEVRIIGSLHNLYGPHNVGHTSMVGPGQWNSVLSKMDCSEYIFRQYGLDGDFKVLRY